MKNIVLVLMAVSALVLAACDDKNKGNKVGLTLQDCASIMPNQREDAARAVKDAKDKAEAAKILATKFNITEAAATACLK